MPLFIAITLIAGCSTIRTDSGDMTHGSSEIKLTAGDRIKIITRQRERFMLDITGIQPEGLRGESVQWDASGVPGGLEFFVAYRDLALIQVEKPSALKTAGLVASVTVIGAMVAAIAVGPAPVMMAVP